LRIKNIKKIINLIKTFTMENNQTSNVTIPELVNQVISIRKKFWSLVALLVLLLFVFGVAFYLLFNYVTSRATEVRFTTSGAVEIRVDNQLSKATFQLSSNGGGCSPWVNTGIEVEVGDEIRFFVSGKICVAAHRMFETAALKNNFKLPPIPWTDKYGLEGNKECKPIRDVADNNSFNRKKYLVAEDYQQGRIIGAITLPNVNPKEHLPKSEVIDVPIYENENYYKVVNKGVLYLTVNEVWLETDLMNKLKPNDLAISKEEFKFIKGVGATYSNVWYDDNSGSFSMLIEKKKK
jgi:hypothetical protein